MHDRVRRLGQKKEWILFVFRIFYMGIRKVFRDHYYPPGLPGKSMFLYIGEEIIKWWISVTQHYGAINWERSNDDRLAFELWFANIVGFDDGEACYGIRVVAVDRHHGLVTAYPISRLPLRGYYPLSLTNSLAMKKKQEKRSRT